MTRVMTWFWTWIGRDGGQGLIEYAGIAGLVAIAIATVTAAGLLDGPITSLFTGIGECIDFDDTCP